MKPLEINIVYNYIKIIHFVTLPTTNKLHFGREKEENNKQINRPENYKEQNMMMSWFI